MNIKIYFSFIMRIMYIVYYSKKKISSLNTSLIINIFKGELNAYALGLVNSDFFFFIIIFV